MAYCLAEHEQWPENIICGEVADYIRDERKRHLGEESFPLHKYLHHGLSSQAMVFNLIGPLVVRNDLEPLQIATERAGISWPEGDVSAGFEHNDRAIFNEDSGQPTSIDLLVSGDTGSLFVEAKLVEREFGGCSVFAAGDCEGQNPLLAGITTCYLHHIGRKYWERMEEFGFGSTKLASGSVCPFANYYQFFREALFALVKGGRFVLLHDERNPAFVSASGDGFEQRGLWLFLLKAVPERHLPSIKRLTIRRVVAAIEAQGRHEDWIGTFKLKYGIA